MTKRKVTFSTLAALALTLVLALPAFAHDGVGGDEYASADIMLVVAVGFMVFTGIMVMISWHNGEFHNPEQIKRQMLQMALTDEDGDELDQYALTEA